MPALAAVDVYIGATEPAEDDPLEQGVSRGIQIRRRTCASRIWSRERPFACGPSPTGPTAIRGKKLEKEITLKDLPECYLFNPRNAYQNYNCAVNLSEKTIYTYMGVLRPQAGNANYCSAGQLSPLLNDPLYKTIGIGTRIFLGGGQGFVVWRGTQHNPNVKRGRTRFRGRAPEPFRFWGISNR